MLQEYPLFMLPQDLHLRLIRQQILFSIGMAGYTFREFTVEKTIEMMKRIGVTNLSLKDFHMPMNSTQEQINAVLEKFKTAGINVYTVGLFI